MLTYIHIYQCNLVCVAYLGVDVELARLGLLGNSSQLTWLMSQTKRTPNNIVNQFIISLPVEY